MAWMSYAKMARIATLICGFSGLLGDKNIVAVICAAACLTSCQKQTNPPDTCLSKIVSDTHTENTEIEIKSLGVHGLRIIRIDSCLNFDSEPVLRAINAVDRDTIGRYMGKGINEKRNIIINAKLSKICHFADNRNKCILDIRNIDSIHLR